MAQVNVQVLFLLILIIVSSECRVIRTGSAHEAVVLFEVNSDEIDAQSSYRVKVIKYTKDNELMVVFEWPKKAPQARRMSWETDGNGLMSFNLKNLQKSDEGTYSCEMWQGWDRVLMRNMTLKVKECKTLPAVKAKPDSSARLQCSVVVTSEDRRPTNVTWKKVKGSEHISVDSQRVKTEGISLIIQNVSLSDNGWYQCHYVLGQTTYCTAVRLNVQDAADISDTATASNTPTQTLQESPQEADSSAIVIAVVVSVSFGLTAAASLGLFFYCRQQRRKVTAQLQTAGTPTVMGNSYVNWNPPDLHEISNPEYQRINSVYYLDNECLHTFNI